MRLLHTRTLEFFETDHPGSLRYIILSHTWGDEEVSFQQFSKPESKNLQGYKKIEQCCAIARPHVDYIWIDTCCIDKTNNVELSEAINSMFRWYQRSTVCYVYLDDFSNTEHRDTSAFQRCRWFTRGWTLQEFLASEHVEIYDRDWNLIGNPSEDPRLALRISRVTGIRSAYIEQRGLHVRQASVATRMSWASHRRTTRVEDQAYSLMGLFDVNMPLLYGEGSKAFIRLQQEIARTTDDESLFAWHDTVSQSGMFAPSISAFAGCSTFTPYPEPVISRPPYTITNRGVAIVATYQQVAWDSLQGHPLFKDQASCEYILLPLNCARHGDPTRPFTIILRAVSRDIYVRWLPGEVMVHEKYFRPQQSITQRAIYIQEPKQEIHVLGDDHYRSIYPISSQQSPSLGSSAATWYITPPGFVDIQDRSQWTIWFGGWTGFAVTQFYISSDASLIIVFKHVVTQHESPTGSHMVTIEAHSSREFQGPTVQDIVNACYARTDILNVVTLNSEAKQQLDTEYGPVILHPQKSWVAPCVLDLRSLHSSVDPLI